MKTVGQKIEAFNVVGVKPGFNRHEENGVSAFEAVNERSFPGKWKVIYFYPKDFTFVCPTEIVGFPRRAPIATPWCSGRPTTSSLGWRRDHRTTSLNHWQFADVTGSLVDQLGVRDANEGVGCARRSSSTRTTRDPARLRQQPECKDATPKRSCAFWTGCRPTSSAPAIAAWAAARCKRVQPWRSTMQFINIIKDRLPDYAKDIRLNLDTVIARSSLSPTAAAGAALAAAFAARSSPIVDAIAPAAARRADQQAALTAAALMGMNSVRYRTSKWPTTPTRTMRAELRMNAYANHGGVDRQSFDCTRWRLDRGRCEFCALALLLLQETGFTTQQRDVGRIAANQRGSAGHAAVHQRGGHRGLTGGSAACRTVSSGGAQRLRRAASSRRSPEAGGEKAGPVCPRVRRIEHVAPELGQEAFIFLVLGNQRSAGGKAWISWKSSSNRLRKVSRVMPFSRDSAALAMKSEPSKQSATLNALAPALSDAAARMAASQRQRFAMSDHLVPCCAQ
jgi:hypothetical protein